MVMLAKVRDQARGECLCVISQ